MSATLAPTMPLEERWRLAQERYRGTIRTFARNSYYKMPSFDQEDVEQELMVVLYECVMKYDPDKGATFNTYFQQSARNKVISLIRYFEAKTRVANQGVLDLDDDAVRFAVERAQRGVTSEDIALQRMELQKIYDEQGLEAIVNPKRRRRSRKSS